MKRNAHRLKPVPPVPSTVFPVQTACWPESTTVCCRWRKKDGRAKAGRVHRRRHYGSGELHALQRNRMEAGAARGWRGGPRSDGVRLRDGGSRVTGDGAGANSEAVRAFRFLALRYRPHRPEDLDASARPSPQTTKTVHPT